MREFFRGWKRKFGLVTLTIACLSGCGWIRSLSTDDSYSIPSHSVGYTTVCSRRASISLTNEYPVPEPPKQSGIGLATGWRTLSLGNDKSDEFVPRWGDTNVSWIVDPRW